MIYDFKLQIANLGSGCRDIVLLEFRDTVLSGCRDLRYLKRTAGFLQAALKADVQISAHYASRHKSLQGFHVDTMDKVRLFSEEDFAAIQLPRNRHTL